MAGAHAFALRKVAKVCANQPAGKSSAIEISSKNNNRSPGQPIADTLSDGFYRPFKRVVSGIYWRNKAAITPENTNHYKTLQTSGGYTIRSKGAAPFCDYPEIEAIYKAFIPMKEPKRHRI